MTFLRSVALRPDAAGETGYPFDLPLIRALPERDLSAPATFFVGENGSGKSTLLEALAASARMVTIGGAPIHADPTMLPAQRLGTCLRLSWKRKTRSGFFLRAEDFIGYTRQVAGMLAELDEIAEAAKADGQRDWWRAYELAKGERAQLRRGLGDDFDARSHGESFLDLFQRQLRDNGLHLLDEPETPLSPQRQLALLALIRDTAAAGGQFVIATHSPILMVCPGARILLFDDGTIRPMAWEDVPNVRIMRDFLADPALYLRYL